jgi:iron complex outermembrane receptor protein
MDEVVVSTVRATSDAPLTFTDLTRGEITRRNLGQDVPFLLGSTPSVVETSDAGGGFGYTGMRIRGSDPTRINVTINGVPLNDAESHDVFWVDLPDLLSSTQSIQVQRGVGTSTFGAGAFGASVNLNTVSTYTDPHGELSASGGSFGTYRVSAGAGTGLIGNHFTIDGRVSVIQSDGYIDRATADLRSWFGTAAYIAANQSLRLNAFGGHEVTYQAWNGVPAQYIDDPVLRTFNTAGTERAGVPYDNEVDDYTQTHLQLLWNASLFTQIQTSVTLHYTKGKGYFEQYKNPGGFDDLFSDFLATYELENGDAIRRRWLDNDFYGGIAGLHFFDPSDKFEVHIGGAWHRYHGDHFGQVIWSDQGSVDGLPDYYRNDAVKGDRSAFVKYTRNFTPAVSAMVDLQVRGISYEFEGLDSQGGPFPQEVKHTFFNPKVGLSWKMNDKHRLYAFGGVAQREPNRDDYVDSPVESLPRPEKLFNTELGWEYSGEGVRIGINGYHMLYDDQLVLTGRINDVGEYTRQNVDRSSRMGIETMIRLERKKWDATATATLSRNRVKAYEEYIDDWDAWPQQTVIAHENTPLAFSPGIVASGEFGYHLLKDEMQDLRLALGVKHVGKQYIDNSGNAASVLDAYTTSDLRLSYGREMKNGTRIEAQVHVRNLFDARYSSNAWIYRFLSAFYDPRPDDPYAALEEGTTYHLQGLYPQAGRHVLAGLTVWF